LKDNLNILICPLDWGLGHAGRMLPLATRLIESGHKIFFASGRDLITFLKHEMPDADFIDFPGFRPVYSSFLPQYAAILLQLPVIIYHIIKEHHSIKGIIRKYDIDVVISDNRFGLWNRKVRSVYVTHQVRIPFPHGFKWMEPAGIFLHNLVLKKYDYCLIPDLPGEVNLSGKMSHGLKLPSNIRFIGILSRFIKNDQITTESKTIIILSGPEPQKSILRRNLLKTRMPGESFVILDGRPVNEMKENICGSRRIIARAGYSTIMELVSMGCTALLIPTPGQTEQEYLARYLSSKGWFTMIRQNNIGRNSFEFTGSIPGSCEITECSLKLLDSAINEITTF
jgi:hypothetical protein